MAKRQFKNIKQKQLFENIDISKMTPLEIENSRKLYKYICESTEQAISEGKPLDKVIDEGILSGLIGGAVGATIGPSIMRALLKVLGVSEDGAFGKFLTSSIVLGGVGAALGY